MPKWGRVGSPHSAKRRSHLKSIRSKHKPKKTYRVQIKLHRVKTTKSGHYAPRLGRESWQTVKHKRYGSLKAVRNRVNSLKRSGWNARIKPHKFRR